MRQSWQAPSKLGRQHHSDNIIIRARDWKPPLWQRLQANCVLGRRTQVFNALFIGQSLLITLLRMTCKASIAIICRRLRRGLDAQGVGGIYLNLAFAWWQREKQTAFTGNKLRSHWSMVFSSVRAHPILTQNTFMGWVLCERNALRWSITKSR